MEPEYPEWKVGILLNDANNADADNVKTAAMAALNEKYKAAFGKQQNDNNLPPYLRNGGWLTIFCMSILADIGIAISIGVFVGIYDCFTVDFNDDATVNKVKYISIYFGSLVVITVLFATVVANYIKKDALKDFDPNSADAHKTADGLTARVTCSRQIVVIGIEVIVAAFLVVTLFSILFHVNDVEFGLFIGIVIASFIGVMALNVNSATKTEAITSSCILLAYLVLSITTCYYLIYYKGFSYINCTLVGFLSFGFIAAGLAATSDDGIKKLFKDPGYKKEAADFSGNNPLITASGGDWSPIAMLGFQCS